MYSHIEISKEILNHNAIEMNIQNLFFLFIYSLLDTLLVFKSKTILYGLIEIMIAVVMFTVSLLTIEHKALAKKIIAVLKIRAVEEGEVIH